MENKQTKEGTAFLHQRYSIFRTSEALSNWRALGIIAAASVLSGLVSYLGTFLPGILQALLGLVTLVIWLGGISGAGVCLLDQARGHQPQGIGSYALQGLFSLPRLIGLLLLFFVSFLAVILAATIYFFLCKLPFIGPLLLALGIPAMVLLVGATLVGVYVLLALAGPAIWDGCNVLTAFKASLGILRRHAIGALSKLIGGLLLAALLATLFLSIIMSAVATVGTIAGSVIGIKGYLMQLFSPLGLMALGGVDQLPANLMGAAAGFAIVFFVAGALVSLMPCMVAALTWLEFSEKIDLDRVRADANATSEAMHRKLAEVEAKHRPVSPSNAIARPPAANATCPGCQANITPDDRFCGDCGASLA